MTIAKVVIGETSLFRPEEQRGPTTQCCIRPDELPSGLQPMQGMLNAPRFRCRGSDHQGAVSYGLSNIGAFSRFPK